MAYSTSSPPSLIAQRVGGGSGALWDYRSTDDVETVLAANYFTNAADLGMAAGDVVLIHDTDTPCGMTVATVVSVSASGAILSGATQELTATAAVNAGVQVLELNHASTIIAATIANAANHRGLFIVRNTSASGTAAHTLTLTVGTFDGTNNVATLNAPGEALVIFFDGSGRGQVVQNTGTVGLA